MKKKGTVGVGIMADISDVFISVEKKEKTADFGEKRWLLV